MMIERHKEQQNARRIVASLQWGVTRRRFLKWAFAGSVGVVAVAAGGFAWLRRSPLDEQPKPGWADGLSRQEYHLFDRARLVLLPTAGTGLIANDQVPVVENVQRTLAFMDPASRKDVAMALALFDNAAVLRHGQRFVDLSDVRARAYFEHWGAASAVQRTVASVIKQLVYTSYWRDQSTWPPIEYDGPVSDRWGLAYLGNAPLPDEGHGGRGV